MNSKTIKIDQGCEAERTTDSRQDTEGSEALVDLTWPDECCSLLRDLIGHKQYTRHQNHPEPSFVAQERQVEIMGNLMKSGYEMIRVHLVKEAIRLHDALKFSKGLQTSKHVKAIQFSLDIFRHVESSLC